MDPTVVDFLEATKRHKIILNLATIPEWMFKTAKPVFYPADPDVLDYEYEQGNELRDPSMKEVADYFARLAGWYTQGGFKDENGVWHESGHHYHVEYWEVLNEVDFEHSMTIVGIKDSTEQHVDGETNFHTAVSQTLANDNVVLQGFAVSIVTLH